MCGVIEILPQLWRDKNYLYTVIDSAQRQCGVIRRNYLYISK